MDSLLLSRFDMSYRGRNFTDEKQALEKLKSLLNWLTQRNFDKIKDEILQTIRGVPSVLVLKSLVCCIFEMAVLDNAYVLFARLCAELFNELPPFRSHGEITSFERFFLCKCRIELENSSPKTDRPPLVYADESNCWRFIKTVRVLAHVFQNRIVTETTRKSIIQILMDPIFPPERNIDAMNIFLCSIGKLADFKFCDESFNLQVQSARALELENKCNGQVKLREEAEDALAMKMEELEIMQRLLESYKEEQLKLCLQAQALEQEHIEELRLRKETEDVLARERERMEKLKRRMETLEYELDSMRSKAEEFERKYNDELILRKESEIAVSKEKNDLEEMKQLLESCQIEQENLTSQVTTWQDKYDQELSLRKETEDALSREKQELEIVKGLLETYNREADAMRQEKDNALKAVQELERKQLEERQPPPSFFCPITQEIMKDPHFAADGFTYEETAIKRWLNTGHDTSPMTNLKLSHRNLVPNRALRSAIQEFVDKTMQVLSRVFKNKLVSETTRQIIIQAAELEKRYNDEVRHRKEAVEELARKKEEQDLLNFLVQALEERHKEELRLRKKTEYELAIQLEPLDIMRLKADEFESKYKGELRIREQSESALDKEKNDLEATKQLLETCKIEQENLTSQVSTWQDKYDQELSLRKETEDGLYRKKQELERVNIEADEMREERDNALKLVEEITTKQTEESKPLPSFICPISQEVMKDPHLTTDGFTYEAEAIRKWFRTGHETSPMTNLKLPRLNLVPNRALRSAIQEMV